MFKLLVVSAVLVGLAYAEVKTVEVPKEYYDLSTDAIIKCNKAEDPKELISLVSKGWLRQDQTFRDLLHCVYHENGFVNRDGRFNIKKIESVIGDNKEALAASKACHLLKSSPVETTFLNVACFLKQGFNFEFKGLE